MSQIIKVSRGLNIPLIGESKKEIIELKSELYAVKPADFVGFTPRVMVKEGDKVLVGTPLMQDKKHEFISITSPVSGEVVEVRRGEKRLLLAVVVKSDGQMTTIDFGKENINSLSKESAMNKMLISGLWSYIRKRPYGTIAHVDDKPKAIFVSAFDSSPLAPDYDFVIGQNFASFQTGIDVLSLLIDKRKVNLNLNAKNQQSSVFAKTKNAEINYFEGPHPAGNIGTQINKICPINKGDVVWTLDIQAVVMIGKLFNDGVYAPYKTIALTGSEVRNPRYYSVIQGTNIAGLIDNNLTNTDVRIISGNVLSGMAISKDGFISFYDNQITVIPEGSVHEFLGWAMPRFHRFSFYSSYFSWLCPKKKYRLDTNINGGERGMVVTGKFEQVVPLNIYPMQLIKACIIKDLDMMEKLGIYEVEPEDLALCEFIDTSKTDIQGAVREALEMVRKEME